MTREIQATFSLSVRNGNQVFQPPPHTFFADQDNEGGPTPGDLLVDTTGRDVSLAELVQPGWCRIINLGDTYSVEWGVHDGSLFHPVGELFPGEGFPMRFSRNFGEEEDVPGTGTTAPVNTFYLRAIGGSTRVLVEAFET